MPYRSWLFVPANSETKLAKANATGADVVVVDLDASVPFDAKAQARQMGAEWLRLHRRQVVEQQGRAHWVRINSLDSRQWREDLVAVLPGAPEGIILPRSAGPEAVRQLAAELYELEGSNQVQPGSTKILAFAGETAQSAMSIGSYIDASLPRLAGLAWGAERLASVLGAARSRDAKGGWGDAFRFVRAQTLLTAHACGVMALETIIAPHTDTKALKAAAKEARADGFTGMFANHPAQIAEINAAFAPSEAELEEARRIVAAFEGGVDAGDLTFDRRQIDQPQLKLAKQLLGLAETQNQEARPAPILRPA
jgi:citrate lyase subunit beta/citryl-CoA lyase